MNLSLTSSISSSSSSASSSSTGSWLSGIVLGLSNGFASAKMPSKTVSVGRAGGDFSGPVVRKNQFRESLFKYGPKPIQILGASCNCPGSSKMVTCSTTHVLFAYWIWNLQLATDSLMMRGRGKRGYFNKKNPKHDPIPELNGIQALSLIFGNGCWLKKLL
ncbi:uncharacterized protein LOC107423264 isoform X2 [Ziziphus jujuba]|uniref:Uncharacterized protein LOC107423264 isoform X2 n=1 Tax=Ziziphus jujuba TaxID=326968 RepID=A0ABM3IRG0_ZIZJJ|nr:uncharacterized protein LOC107423264 isoform X2 [Ziziphus jujuba]